MQTRLNNQDIILMKFVGINPVIVHGGGQEVVLVDKTGLRNL